MPRMNFKKASPKKIGNTFEKTFKDMALMRGWAVVRIPDGCEWRGSFPILKKSPFDFVIAKEGKAIFLDCKSHSANTFSHSNIVEHQMDALISLRREGHQAGYLVFFSKSCKMIFFDAQKLYDCRSGDGLRQEDGILLGDLFSFDLNKIA